MWAGWLHVEPGLLFIEILLIIIPLILRYCRVVAVERLGSQQVPAKWSVRAWGPLWLRARPRQSPARLAATAGHTEHAADPGPCHTKAQSVMQRTAVQQLSPVPAQPLPRRSATRGGPQGKPLWTYFTLHHPLSFGLSRLEFIASTRVYYIMVFLLGNLRV